MKSTLVLTIFHMLQMEKNTQRVIIMLYRALYNPSECWAVQNNSQHRAGCKSLRSTYPALIQHCRQSKDPLHIHRQQHSSETSQEFCSLQKLLGAYRCDGKRTKLGGYLKWNGKTAPLLLILDKNRIQVNHGGINVTTTYFSLPYLIHNFIKIRKSFLPFDKNLNSC